MTRRVGIRGVHFSSRWMELEDYNEDNYNDWHIEQDPDGFTKESTRVKGITIYSYCCMDHGS